MNKKYLFVTIFLVFTLECNKSYFNKMFEERLEAVFESNGNNFNELSISILSSWSSLMQRTKSIFSTLDEDHLKNLGLNKARLGKVLLQLKKDKLTMKNELDLGFDLLGVATVCCGMSGFLKRLDCGLGAVGFYGSLFCGSLIYAKIINNYNRNLDFLEKQKNAIGEVLKVLNFQDKLKTYKKKWRKLDLLRAATDDAYLNKYFSSLRELLKFIKENKSHLVFPKRCSS